ncbi:unnamed protein product [Caenorhabditis angaria]|uniref:Uncharacterized protein n=1 Tax=Caenorhabditis angaria TaxID=860376 RepID=A0A9P1IXL5_9PELO|nr:unnamed protein product [Caenorhabditis angaria]
MKSAIISILILCLIQIILAIPYFADKEKRGVDDADWQSLGWAWGKRSVPMNSYYLPNRQQRSAHPVKKNPEWEDLSWTWGRK